MKKYLNRIALVGLVASGSAAAMDTEVDVYTSHECGDTDAEVEKGAGESESLRVFFNDFGVQLDHKGIKSKDCRIEAKIKIPAGMQFRAVEAAIEGVYQTDKYTKGLVELSINLTKPMLEAFGILNSKKTLKEILLAMLR